MKKSLLLGNEAIAFGALKAGVGIASGYPGTPSTEIIETLQRFRDRYVEWSVNEKVAFETAYGASIMGAHSLVAMKHVGLNVASDPLMSSSYTGVEGAFVIVSAQDPSMWSSQNEQDNRYYGLMSLIPVIEPYDPQSAYELTVKAFNLSSKVHHPVILSTNTRISHVRGPVEYEEPSPPILGKLQKKPEKYSLVPDVARRDRQEQLKRWELIQQEIKEFNEIEGDGRKLIIASGIAYSYVKEILPESVRILKLSAPVPLNKEQIVKVLEDVDEALIVEELEPIVEMQVKSIAYDEGFRIRIHGKDYVPRSGELTPDVVEFAIKKFLGIYYEPKPKVEEYVPPRPPAMCPGCPHRSSFIDIKRGITLGGLPQTFFSGDIGCYSLGILPPFQEQDSLTNMGSSLGIANGVFRATGIIPVAIIGDSTFFHSGLSALANAVYNNLPVLVVVLDNRVTAMTGQNPSPSKEIDIANVAKGLGVEYVREIDPFNLKESTKIIADATNWVKQNRKPALIVAKRACALDVIDKFDELPIAEVDINKCTGCTICYDYFTCPAIIPREDKKAIIDPVLCIGCGACIPICPYNAISLKGEIPKGWDELWRS
ncbi:indolepyruvate ferredoxin oxidoreductase subunit alpha [Sulfurisphaera tokodaii]|uniref:Indolepyruvate oxidoreductase subunit IorA n=2 Tax=Sulfurisphaera tokodaii TaxID=111955 RepID=Q974C0_SULTO|nr:indolepyruvate ferredoxin oxidoreductase subunit alpha [Sulfurisphaera tokodaii]BAB65740.1 indolepyruvate--ferredoxin oxidoreductase alpha subunit [Sulfurisphaera tokodaii str. 7]HII72817.1 indolepyruvate ferredoxin oxidoreductase subunit alpha [Sulfurisphaera tokodaii]